MKIACLVVKEYQERIFSEKYYDRMRKHGDLVIFDQEQANEPEKILSLIKGAEVLVTSWDTPVLEKLYLDACPDLKVVLHAAGSIKPIISDEFLNRNIRITNSAIALGEGVAETALGFAISSCKGFYSLDRDTKNGLWNENVKTTVKDFYDITVGVIGGGYVGRHMVKLLSNFHVDVLMYDPTLSEEEIKALGAKKADLNELMTLSDVVSIHAPSIPETNGMINESNLSMMKDGAILINTARGSIINEADLIDELKKERIFACIDVTDPEPPLKENELRYLKNVVLTPHIAGAVTNGLKKVALHVCEELDRFMAGEKMKTEVELSQLSKLA